MKYAKTDDLCTMLNRVGIAYKFVSWFILYLLDSVIDSLTLTFSTVTNCPFFQKHRTNGKENFMASFWLIILFWHLISCKSIGFQMLLWANEKNIFPKSGERKSVEQLFFLAWPHLFLLQVNGYIQARVSKQNSGDYKQMSNYTSFLCKPKFFFFPGMPMQQ